MEEREEEQTFKKGKSKLGWSLIPILGIVLVLVILAVTFSDVNITGLSVLGPDQEPGVIGYEPPQLETYTFQDVHNEVEKIDGIYGTDYHKESYVRDRVSKEKLRPIIGDITKLYLAIESSADIPEKKWFLRFLDFRMGLLDSQLYLEKALRFGLSGVITENFRCEQNETVLLATQYYNQSLRLFHQAEFYLDDVLTNLRESREYIGVGENKPQIYASPEGGEIAKTINANIYYIDRYCKQLPELIEKEKDTTKIALTKQ